MCVCGWVSEGEGEGSMRCVTLSILNVKHNYSSYTKCFMYHAELDVSCEGLPAFIAYLSI